MSTLVALFGLIVTGAVAAENYRLEEGFRAPPDSARPRTWWHWVSGNVSSEGITADLQAMKEIGLGGSSFSPSIKAV